MRGVGGLLTETTLVLRNAVVYGRRGIEDMLTEVTVAAEAKEDEDLAATERSSRGARGRTASGCCSQRRSSSTMRPSMLRYLMSLSLRHRRADGAGACRGGHDNIVVIYFVYGVLSASGLSTGRSSSVRDEEMKRRAGCLCISSSSSSSLWTALSTLFLMLPRML